MMLGPGLRRGLLYGFISIAAALASTRAWAETYVYRVSVSLGHGRFLTGSITTNCNDCALNVSNVVAFKFNLMGPPARPGTGNRWLYTIGSPPSQSLAPYTPGYISEMVPLPLVAYPTGISFDPLRIWDGSITFSDPRTAGSLVFAVQNYVAMINWYDLPRTTRTSSTLTTIMGIPSGGFAYQIASR